MAGGTMIFVSAVLYLMVLCTLQGLTVGRNTSSDIALEQLEALEADIDDSFRKMYGFCISDFGEERGKTFQFGPDLVDSKSCPGVEGGICTQVEVRLYMDAILSSAGGVITISSNGICNDTSPIPGCASGYFAPASSVLLTTRNKTVGLPCCPGFFCPSNLACMIPCPRGSRCGSPSHFDRSSQRCTPYPYLSGGNRPACAGADMWGVAGAQDQIFCDIGSICLNTTDLQGIPCPRGHFCRKGVMEPTKCSPIASCSTVKAGQQDLHSAGLGFILLFLVALALAYWVLEALLDARRHMLEMRRSMAHARVRSQQMARLRWRNAAKEVIRVFVHMACESGDPDAAGAGRVATSGTERNDDQIYSSQREGVPLPSASSRGDARGLENRGVKRPTGSAGRGAWSGSEIYREGRATGSEAYGGPAGDINTPVAVGRRRRSRHRTVDYSAVYTELDKIDPHSKMSTEQTLATVLLQARTVLHHRVKLRLDLKFIDVNLYLKNNNLQLLDGITGELRAGNVTAVMGPSGAGKSMFFSAIAGKVSGCRVTGQVLINGRDEPIKAYRQIVGFVAQDDIVHGNLTVEENLWFSASYRLPNGMARTRKFLAVERTILALGLDDVRHNLVGTVEKRGISGGQRKRVNVGLEMVIEPSLLILDEPTSGLDSSASFLVIQALRREAARGVNIGVVLHQPSYKLFHMFDDIMFLGKGGKLVYLGPVSEVEGYFSSLGWVVPDRVNPPDQFMDVLGGLVESTKGVKLEDLPRLWVEHKGYRLRSQEEVVLELGGPGKRRGLFSWMWGRFRDRWQHQVEEIREVVTPQKNLSQRVTPRFVKQLWLMIARIIRQRMRESPLLLRDYISMLFAGAALGYLAPTNDDRLGGPDAYIYTIITISLTGTLSALRTFGDDRLTYFRESASGINKLSYFVAKDVMDWPHILLKPLAYMGLFYFFNYPRSTFVDNYGITVCLFYCVTGMGYVLAITLSQSIAMVSAAVLSLVATLIASKPRPTGLIKALSVLDFAGWALEAFILANARRYAGVWLLTRCAGLHKFGYNINDYGLDIFILLLFGLVARLAAFCALVFGNRGKQK